MKESSGGVTSACPMFAIRWLTYLAGAGFSPAGIIDLARPHTPFDFDQGIPAIKRQNLNLTPAPKSSALPGSGSKVYRDHLRRI